MPQSSPAACQAWTAKSRHGRRCTPNPESRSAIRLDSGFAVIILVRLCARATGYGAMDRRGNCVNARTGSPMQTAARATFAVFASAAMLALAGCGGGNKGPSSSTTPTTTPMSSVAPSTAPGTGGPTGGGGGSVPGGPTGGGGPNGGGGSIPGGPTGSGGPNGGGGSIPGVGGGGGGPNGGGGCVGGVCGGGGIP